MTQLAMSPASSRAQRCSVTASLNVLLSRSSLVTAVTMSIRRVMDSISPGGATPPVTPSSGTVAPAVTTSRRAPSVSTLAVRVAGTGPPGPSSVQSACLAAPVLAAAASWLCTAAREGRSTNAVSGLPVA